ncbi:hypothetical protein BC940DRAFT_332257 [Gongronella butleri]|nr:hypothetical protein BC940DRAFT_332257 [Gongronella butleri]
MLKTVAIIGGGIGGLNLANALRVYAPNLEVTVYDQIKSPEHQQGWHLGINQNGLAAMKEAQIENLAEATRSNMVTGFVVLDEKLNELLRMGGPAQAATAANGEDSAWAIAILHRRTLHRLLAQKVDIVYNKRFTRYEEKDDGIDVFFEDGSKITADIAIGADGCWSQVRKQLCPSIRYEGVGVSQFGIMFDAPDPKEIPHLMTWLPFAMVRSSSPNGYSILTGVASNDTGGKDMFVGLSWPDSLVEGTTLPTDNAGMLQWMQKIVHEHFHPEFAKLVDRATGENVVLGGTRQVHSTKYQPDCPLTKIKHQRVTLLGDAAHATSPNAGLGANTALMDSIDLAKALAREDWQVALGEYETTMWARGQSAVKESLRNTWRNHSSGPISFAFGKIFMKGLNQFFKWKGMNSY